MRMRHLRFKAMRFIRYTILRRPRPAPAPPLHKLVLLPADYDGPLDQIPASVLNEGTDISVHVSTDGIQPTEGTSA